MNAAVFLSDFLVESAFIYHVYLVFNGVVFILFAVDTARLVKVAVWRRVSVSIEGCLPESELHD